MFYSLSWEMGSEGSHIRLALLARGKESSPSTMCVSEASRLPGTSFSHRQHPSFPPLDLAVSQYVPDHKTSLSEWESEWVCSWDAKWTLEKISVKFSFGLKIWNSFAPLTFSSCGGVQTHGDTTPGCHCSECSCFRLGNRFSSVFLSLRAYTLATLGKSLSELYFPHL